MPFTNSPWDAAAVKRNLDVEDYRKVCLIVLGDGKTKEQCKLPVRATPGGPINVNAMAAAAAVLAGGRGGVDAPSEKKRSAARRLIRLYREAEREPPPALKRVAGTR